MENALQNNSIKSKWKSNKTCVVGRYLLDNVKFIHVTIPN